MSKQNLLARRRWNARHRLVPQQEPKRLNQALRQAIGPETGRWPRPANPFDKALDDNQAIDQFLTDHRTNHRDVNRVFDRALKTLEHLAA